MTKNIRVHPEWLELITTTTLLGGIFCLESAFILGAVSGNAIAQLLVSGYVLLSLAKTLGIVGVIAMATGISLVIIEHRLCAKYCVGWGNHIA